MKGNLNDGARSKRGLTFGVREREEATWPTVNEARPRFISRPRIYTEQQPGIYNIDVLSVK